MIKKLINIHHQEGVQGEEQEMGNIPDSGNISDGMALTSESRDKNLKTELTCGSPKSG